MNDQSQPFEGWCVLELMGHRRLGGYVREQQIAGAAFVRIDVPGVNEGDEARYASFGDKNGGAATQFYAPGAVYCITPTTEEIARAVAANFRPEPVSRWELRAIEAPKPNLRPFEDPDYDPYENDPDPMKYTEEELYNQPLRDFLDDEEENDDE